MEGNKQSISTGDERALVAIMNNKLDFSTAWEEHWYRIPVASAHRWLRERWPPQWLAFYQTKVFGPEKYAINYYARVLEIDRVRRWQLFPDQPRDERSNREYYRLWLEPLSKLPRPIPSRRWRRVIFIPTTFATLMTAGEINDLYNTSPLENALWHVFRSEGIPAERQWHETVGARNYFLDFAIHCATGKIDVETDGDTWHANPAAAKRDNRRDNDLETAGWHVIRFTSKRIREEVEDYCLDTVVKAANRLGGIENGGVVPRQAGKSAGAYQARLFDDQ